MKKLALPQYSWIANFVYGAVDGSVTTFAVVAGVQGAHLPLHVVLILGFANLISDGISMAVSKYSGDKADKERIEKLRQAEYQALRTHPAEEAAEVKVILASYGLHGPTLEQAQGMIMKNPEHYVNLMLRHEFNVIDEAIFPIRGAMTTFIAFILVGLVPLLGFILQYFISISRDHIFLITSIFTLLTLFFVGVLKSRFTTQFWLKSGLVTMVFGGVAATAAYIVGFLLKGIVTI